MKIEYCNERVTGKKKNKTKKTSQFIPNIFLTVSPFSRVESYNKLLQIRLNITYYSINGGILNDIWETVGLVRGVSQVFSARLGLLFKENATTIQLSSIYSPNFKNFLLLESLF